MLINSIVIMIIIDITTNKNCHLTGITTITNEATSSFYTSITLLANIPPLERMWYNLALLFSPWSCSFLFPC